MPLVCIIARTSLLHPRSTCVFPPSEPNKQPVVPPHPHSLATAQGRSRPHIHTMLDHLMPHIFDDCDFFDDANKENVGYFVRRPTASLRSELDGTPVLLRRRSVSSSGRRTPPVRTSTITPQDAHKKVMHKTAAKKATRAQSAKAAARSNRSKQTETSKKAKRSSGGSQSLGIIRRPLRDITYLYLSERSNAVAVGRERRAREAQATSVSMRFF